MTSSILTSSKVLVLQFTQWAKTRKKIQFQKCVCSGCTNSTMYDFHNSTDTLKFWTEKWAINKTFSFILMKLGEVVVPQCVLVLQFHQVSSKSDEKQKSFINSPFFFSELQSVSRIVKENRT